MGSRGSPGKSNTRATWPCRACCMDESSPAPTPTPHQLREHRARVMKFAETVSDKGQAPCRRSHLSEVLVTMTWVDSLARQCVLARKEYVPGKPVEEVKRELGLSDVIKLASNENPLGTSPMALAAMIDELRVNGGRYPDSLCYDLSQRLAEIHGLSLEQLFIDNGLDGVITMIGLTFLNPGDECVFGTVTFPAYENIATKMGAVCVRVPIRADY